MRPGYPDSRCLGQPPEPPRGRMPVHPRAVAVEQDRPEVRAVHGAVDGPAYRWGQRDQDDLAAFPADLQDPVAVFFAKPADVRTGGLEDPQAEQPEHGDQGEVVPVSGLAAAVSNASNCRCVNPRLGDSAGTAGRRTYSAGERSRTPSMTQVR
jgi:hypothetical protein